MALDTILVTWGHTGVHLGSKVGKRRKKVVSGEHPESPRGTLVDTIVAHDRLKVEKR